MPREADEKRLLSVRHEFHVQYFPDDKMRNRHNPRFSLITVCNHYFAVLYEDFIVASEQ